MVGMFGFGSDSVLDFRVWESRARSDILDFGFGFGSGARVRILCPPSNETIDFNKITYSYNKFLSEFSSYFFKEEFF